MFLHFKFHHSGIAIGGIGALFSLIMVGALIYNCCCKSNNGSSGNGCCGKKNSKYKYAFSLSSSFLWSRCLFILDSVVNRGSDNGRNYPNDNRFIDDSQNRNYNRNYNAPKQEQGYPPPMSHTPQYNTYQPTQQPYPSSYYAPPGNMDQPMPVIPPSTYNTLPLR